MDNKKQPAFAHAAQFGKEYNNDIVNEPGLTKREYIASMAMQGFISNSTFFQGFSSNEDMARQAVDMADKLLKEL